MNIEKAKQNLERMLADIKTGKVQPYKSAKVDNLDNLDEDYYCKCLNCGRIVLCGPQCCDNFKSQSMVDDIKQMKDNVADAVKLPRRLLK